jgi:histidinol-phosphatase (PHP family)
MKTNHKSANFWANYHGHSFFCDGNGYPEEYIKRAVELRMKIIGISSHAPVPFETGWNMNSSRQMEYLDLIKKLKEKYAGQIEVLASMEVDFIPGMMGPGHQNVEAANLDYIIGSVHFADPFPDGTPFSIDDPTELFIRVINEIYEGDVKKAVRRYFELQQEMLDQQPPHIIGHLDKIRMHNRNRFFFDETDDWYLQLLHDTLKLAAEKGVIVEVNTKYYKTAGLSFPSSEHFLWMAENNIPMTLSSDAHQPDNLLSGFGDVAGLLKGSGIDHLWQYQGNGLLFSPREYNEEGINW